MDWPYGDYFEIAPDGRFLALKNVATTGQNPGQSELAIVLNWLEELRRLVPVK